MTTATLYDLADDRRLLLDALLTADEDGDEEAVAALAAELAAIEYRILDKSDGYVWVLKELEAQAEAYKTREVEFAAKRKARENAARRLKERLQAAMEAMQVAKVEGADYTLALQASPPRLAEVDEQAAVAADLAEEVTTIRVDSRAILARWKADPTSIEGIAQVERGQHLRIR